MHDRNRNRILGRPCSKWHSSIFPLNDKNNLFHHEPSMGNGEIFVGSANDHNFNLPEFRNDRRAKCRLSCVDA